MSIPRSIIIATVIVILSSISSCEQANTSKGNSSGFFRHDSGLWVVHDTELLGSTQNVRFLIVTSEKPEFHTDHQVYELRFKGGFEFHIEADNSNLIWIDPRTGVSKAQTNLKVALEILEKRTAIGERSSFGSAQEIVFAIEATLPNY